MSAASASAAKRRILLVDDIELNRILTEAVLRSATYEVDSVDNGTAALAALEGRTYDLVLMDLEMPGLDGHDAAAAIRRREIETASHHSVKLAALSARDGTAARLRSAEVGMAAHITRPVAPHELLRQIERVFCQPTIEPEPDIWQRDAYEEWASRLGAHRIEGFLVSLLDQFRNLLMLLSARAGRDDLHRLAHDVASTGGMLGFPEVTRCCRALLEGADEQVDRAARHELARVLERAVARLDRHLMPMEAAATGA